MRIFRSTTLDSNANTYVGPFGEITVGDNLQLRIQDNTTPGGVGTTGDIDFNGNIISSPTGQIAIQGDIVPLVAGYYQLGDQDNPWATTYTFAIQGANLTVDSGGNVWTFGTDGNLTLPAGGTINFADGSNALVGGGGAIIQSPTPPPDPTTSTLWYDENTGRLYVYYQDVWVDAAPALAGPTGPIGNNGPTGPTGPGGGAGTGNITFTDTTIGTVNADSNVFIRTVGTSTYDWTFSNVGVLAIPDAGTITSFGSEGFSIASPYNLNISTGWTEANGTGYLNINAADAQTSASGDSAWGGWINASAGDGLYGGEGGVVTISGGEGSGNLITGANGQGGSVYMSGGNGAQYVDGAAITNITLSSPVALTAPNNNVNNNQKIYINNLYSTTELNAQSFYVQKNGNDILYLYQDPFLEKPVDGAGMTPYSGSGGNVYASTNGGGIVLIPGYPSNTSQGIRGSIDLVGNVYVDSLQPLDDNGYLWLSARNSSWGFTPDGTMLLPDGSGLGNVTNYTMLYSTQTDGVAMVAGELGNAIAVTSNLGAIISSNSHHWEFLGNATVVGAQANSTQQQVQGTTTKIAGDPFPSFIIDSNVAVIWTASSPDIVGADLLIKAQGTSIQPAGDIVEMARVSMVKNPFTAPNMDQPMVTVYGQVTSNSTISFTTFDGGLDGSNALQLIANTMTHGNTRTFTYQVTEFKKTYD